MGGVNSMSRAASYRLKVSGPKAIDCELQVKASRFSLRYETCDVRLEQNGRGDYVSHQDETGDGR